MTLGEESKSHFNERPDGYIYIYVYVCIYLYNTTIHPLIDINKHHLTSSNLITQQPSEHMSINQKEMQPTSKEGCFVIFNYLGSEPSIFFGGTQRAKVNSYSMLQHILSIARHNLKQLGNAVQQNAILIVARGMLNWA